MRVKSGPPRTKSNAVRRDPFAPCLAVYIFLTLACVFTSPPTRAAQGELTPQQQEVKVLSARLSSAEVE
jgi:hypothetical protein